MRFVTHALPKNLVVDDVVRIGRLLRAVVGGLAEAGTEGKAAGAA